MKLDTENERLDAVKNLHVRLGKMLKVYEHSEEPINHLDILCIIVMSERLAAIKDLIIVEMLLNSTQETLKELENLSERLQGKFLIHFEQMDNLFVKNFLMNRLESMTDFPIKQFKDPRVIKLRKEFVALSTALRNKYKEIYKI